MDPRSSESKEGRIALVAIAAGLVLSCPGLAGAAPCTDEDPPDLAITSPARAAALQLGGTADTVVTVEVLTGDAASMLVSLVIDGVEQLGAPLEAGRVESLQVDRPSRWGLNVVTAEALDACGNRREVAQSYLRSGAYFPAATAPASGALVPGGVVAQLNQVALDDDDRGDLDDVASLADSVFGTVAWDSLIPVTLAGSLPPPCTFPNTWVVYRISRGTVTAPAPHVDYLSAQSFGMSAQSSLASLSMPITGRVWSCTLGILLSVSTGGTLSLSSASATVDLGTRVVQGEPVVDLLRLELDGGSASFTFDCGIAQILCDAITSLVVPLVQGLVEDVLEDQVAGGIPDIVEGFLGSLRIASTVALAPPLATDVQLATSLVSITSYGSFGSIPGALRLGLAAQAYPEAPLPELVGLPGAARRNGGGATLPTLSPLGVEVRDDLVNQVLWAIWYGGGLAVSDLRPLAEAAGLDGVTRLTAFAELPPVVMPSAAPGLVEIGIGDLFVSATVDLGEVLGPPFGGSIEFEIYVSALVEGSFAADAERQKLVFEPAAAHGAIEVVALDDPRLAGALRAVLEPAVGGFMAGLVEVLVGSIPLPSFPLSDLVASQQGRVLALASPTVDRPLDDSTRVTGAIVNRPDCGDGLVLAGEACDDANRAPGDGCDDACRVEPGFACAGQPSACAPLCGNGALDPGEGCDDGARLDGDGCDAACTVEPGFVCAGEPSQCRGTGTPITGTRLGIVNRVPDDEKKNRLAFVARDPAIPLAVPGSADDPRCSAPGGGGGALAVASPTSGQSFAQDLPCDNWELLGTETEPRGYQYSDKELDDGPCRRVTIIGGKRVEAICVGRGPGYLGYDLEEGRAEPPVRVRLTVGEQLLCAAFPGATKDGSDGRKLVSIDAPPPASCP